MRYCWRVIQQRVQVCVNYGATMKARVPDFGKKCHLVIFPFCFVWRYLTRVFIWHESIFHKALKDGIYLFIFEKSSVSLSMFSPKQRKYWYHFYNLFGMTRSLTGDWTLDPPPALVASTIPLGYRGGDAVVPLKTKLVQ